MSINFDHSNSSIKALTSSITFSMDSAIVRPVVSTAQRPLSPTDGMIRFNTTLAAFEGYNAGGGRWTVISKH